MHYNNCYWNDMELAINSVPNLERLFGKVILVSGSTGMIGSTIVELLLYINSKYNANIAIILAGREKRKVDKRFSGILHGENYSFVEYDSTKLNYLEFKTDYIISCAGNSSPKYYNEKPIETILNNILGVQSLLELAKENKGRLLFVSSSEVYGKKVSNSQLINEEEYGYIDVLNPRSCYPCGKRAAESLCISYNQEFLVDVVIARPGHIYGPSFLLSDTKVSSLFALSALKGENIVLKSTGEQKRSYCYSLDCASAILATLINGESCEAYNISNKESVTTIFELAHEFAKCGNVDIVFEIPSVEETKAFNPMQDSALDSKKLYGLGWSGKFSLEYGVRRTYEIMKESCIGEIDVKN